MIGDSSGSGNGGVEAGCSGGDDRTRTRDGSREGNGTGNGSGEGNGPGDGAGDGVPVGPVVVGDLRVEADLELEVDGERVSVRSGAGRVDVAAGSLGALRAVAGLRDRLPAPVAEDIDDVPVGLHVRGVEVARVDPGVSAGPLSRALGLAPARVDLVGVARSVIRRRG